MKATSLRFHLWIRKFTSTLSASALLLSILLLYSFCSTTSSVNNGHMALAIPNQLQKNKNNNITNLTSSVKPVNHPPIVKVGPDQSVNESSKVMLFGLAIDPDPNDKLSYSWTQIAGPAVMLNGHDTASPTFTAPSYVSSDTQLKFALAAKDDKGVASDKPAIVTITVKHTNQPPIANAGTDQIVNAGYIVTLDGTKSKDPDSGDQLSYSWVQTTGPMVILNGANSPIATFAAPSNVSADTILVFKLTVRDSKNGTGTATVKVTDKYTPPPNQSPVANAGADQTANAGDIVHLDGTKSKDSDGTIKSYSWKQIGGPNVAINGADKPNPSFTAPSNISSATSTVLVFGLTVTDDKNATGISTVKITVNPVNHPPVANAGQDQTVNPGYVVSLDGTKSKDPDNDLIKYSWKQVRGPAVELNGVNQSIATFTAPSNISSDTDLTFELTVKDSKDATNTATVKVTDKYIPPLNQTPVANAGTDQTVNATDNVTLNGSASSDPDGTITSYSWMQTSGPFAALSGANTSTPSFTAPNVSSDTELKFSLTVKDDKGAASNNHDIVSVTVKAAVSSQFTNTTASLPSGNMTAATNTQSNINQANNYRFVRTWGSNGTADGEFSYANGIAVDSKTGNVYVSDSGNHRIQKFDSNGNFITKWGSNGDGDGQFYFPSGVDVDSSGNVYVADDNHRVQKFSSDGNFIIKWGSHGHGDGQFEAPRGIAFDPSDNVYVADWGDNRVLVSERIQKFDSNGNFITKWGYNGTEFAIAIAVDSSGNVYVAEYGNDRIQKFDSNGNFITKWGSYGTGDGQFDGPEGIAVDSSGNVYVADTGNDRIQKFDSNGNFITKWGSVGTGYGEFDEPRGVAVDTSGNVYITEGHNSRIQVFAPQK